MANKITVVDAKMGNGKTQYAIQEMMARSHFEGRKFIYITPYLQEVRRVCESLSYYKVPFKQPKVDKDTNNKLDSFSKLLKEGENIVTTHALFDRIDEKALSILRLNQYDLYLDEVFDVVKILKDITEVDFKMLLHTKKCRISEEGRVEWLDANYSGKFDTLKNLCNLGEVYRYSDKLLVYNFPIKVFDKMNTVNVFTFGFKGQIQYGYYKFYKKELEFKTVYKKEDGTYSLKEYNREEVIEDFAKTMEKIHIYEGPLNMTLQESKDFPLSSTRLKLMVSKNSEELKTLQKTIYNFFKHTKPKCKSKEVLWTTLKDAKKFLKGDGYTKGFTSLNLRATNDYDDRIKLAYVFDRYFNPIQKNFLNKKGIKLDQDRFALVELLQWIFRSRIRRGEEVWVYIPNYRMRELLKNWREYI